ncbi:MAG: c-type cytochrome [Pirellulaceae bacterium]
MNAGRPADATGHRSDLATPVASNISEAGRDSHFFGSLLIRHGAALLLLGLLLGTFLAIGRQAVAQEAAEFFRQNCTSCHTIGGGRLNGPDLKEVAKRQEREWLVRFIADPQAMLDSGDPYAAKLKEEAKGQVMTKVRGINAERAEALLMLIEAESQLERSQFVGLQVSMEPFTPEDVALGRAYFTGARRLKNGATLCLACHAVRGVGALGGGRLGPDLSLVYERLEGRRNLSAWLSAPATTTMQPVFKDRALEPEEISALVAFFEHSANQGGEEGMHGPLGLLLLGLGGAVAGLVLMDSIWKNRFRDVRRLLVRGPRRQGEPSS